MNSTTGPGPADGLHTLGRWTTDRSLATPHRIAVDDRGCTLSYGELERRAAGFHARVFQHEYDHMDGVLYPQRLANPDLFGFADEIRRDPPALPGEGD